MLNVTLTPHREFLPAESPHQKLFVMLKLQPTPEVAMTRPSTSFAFVIDTSGSMYEAVMGDPLPTGRTVSVDGQDYEEVTGVQSKIDIVIDALTALIKSGRLDESDRVAIVQFDDAASTLIPLTPATEVSQLESAIAQLRQYSGGTQMGLGMEQAFKLLSDCTMTIRRILILTDGHTFDEDRCRELAKQFAPKNIPITALGVGDYEEDLLIHLGDTTGGNLIHIVPDHATGTEVAIADLPGKIIEEYTQAQQEVINNLKLTVKTVQGAKLTRIVRAYPTQADFPCEQLPYPLGNAAANDETVFILEFNLDSRAASRVRIAQIGLTYDVPGQNRRGELPPENVVVQFVAGQMGAQVNPEVMGYLQQCNVANLVKQATQVANTNPEKAKEILATASRMTQKLGNTAMTRSLSDAQDELRKTRKISPERCKTLKMGAKGKTVRLNNDLSHEISDEAIRQATGT